MTMPRSAGLVLTLAIAISLVLARQPASGIYVQDGGPEATISALETEVAILRASATAQSPSPTPSPTIMPPSTQDVGSTRGNPVDLGEEVVAGDLALTVLEVIWGEEAATAVKAANEYNATLPPEQEYVAIRVRARNIGSGSELQDIDGDVNFGVTASANVLYIHAAAPPDPALEASLLPGGEVDGWVVKRIFVDETNAQLVYRGGFSFEDWRYLALEDGARLPVPPAEDAEATTSPTSGTAPNDLGSQRNDPANPGEVAVMPPYAVEVVRSTQAGAATALLIEAGMEELLDLQAGNEFVLVEVRITNVGEAEVPIRSYIYDFTLSGSANVAYTPELNVRTVVEHLSPTGPLHDLVHYLYPEGVVAGWLLFQVERGERSLVLGYEPILGWEPSGGETRFLATE